MNTSEIVKLLQLSGEQNPEHNVYREALAAALRLPINREIEKDNIARTLFQVDVIPAGGRAVYPLDIEPGEAWYLPRIGSAPQHLVGVEEIHIPTFEIADSREWKLQLAREGRINIVQRVIRSMSNSIIKKENAAAWETIKGVPFRTVGGTFNELNKSAFNSGFQRMQEKDGRNVDVIVLNSLRAGEVREWSSNDLDPMTMREIWRNAGLGNIWGADIIIDNNVPSNEIWFFDTKEMGIMPITLEFTTYDDPTAIRNFRQGILGHEEVGFYVTDPEAIVKLEITS